MIYIYIKDNSFKVIVVLALAVFSYGLYHSFFKQKELNKSAEFTIGVITKIYKIPQRGYFIQYYYKVDDKIVLALSITGTRKDSLSEVTILAISMKSAILNNLVTIPLRRLPKVNSWYY